MAGAWHGGLAGAEEFAQDPDLRANISTAMGFWFSNDFTNNACLDSGGTAACPCTTPGFWNTVSKIYISCSSESHAVHFQNWFSNIIGTPELVSMTCLLLNDTLLQTELDHCTTITGRAYALIDQNINGVGILTGANTLDVAKVLSPTSENLPFFKTNI